MSSKSVQHKDYIVKVKMSKSDSEIVDILKPLQRDGTGKIKKRSADAVHQAMHADLVRSIKSGFETEYFAGSVESIPNTFLKHVAKTDRKNICWSVEKIGEGDVILEQSDFFNYQDIQDKLALRETVPWMKPLVKQVREVKPVPVEDLSYGFIRKGKTSKTTKA